MSTSYLRSVVLVVGQSSIYSLLPTTLVAQAESLIQSNRLAEAAGLLERAGTDLSGDPTLCYLHQCVGFAYMGQTRFREAAAHFIKGTVDPRVLISYFDELRPALFNESPSHNREGSSMLSDVKTCSIEVEIWDGIRDYMPDEKNIDDLIATNLVRNYSPYLRPDAIPDSAENTFADAEPSTSDSVMASGTRTHPATVAMHEVLRGEATKMMTSILSAVLGSTETWTRDVMEVTSTALGLIYANARDMRSLLALFAPSSFPSSVPSSHAVSRSSSRPSSRPGSSSHTYTSNGHQSSIPSSPLYMRHTSHPSKTLLPDSAPLFRPEVLAPVLTKLNLWGTLLEMWKVCGNVEKTIDILAGLSEGIYTDSLVIDPLEQIFTILFPSQTESSTSTTGVGLSISEHERSSLIKKWATWLTGRDVERGLKLLTSLQTTRHGRPTVSVGRGRAKTIDREDGSKADELVILSELRKTSPPAAKRYLEWLVVCRGLGRGGKETTEEAGLYEELVWNYVEEVLEYARNDSIGRLWKAKAASYASSPATSVSACLPPPAAKSDSMPSPIHVNFQGPLRSSFLSYFASTTPDSPSKRARIKGVLLLQSLKEGKRLVKDIQDKLTDGGWERMLGLEMAILHSKTPCVRVILNTLYTIGDTATAEAYASSGGLIGVVSAKTGASAAEGCGLSDWSRWFTRVAAGPKEEDKGKTDGDMLQMLLEVYMEYGDVQQTAKLLSSQAKRLDALAILPLVPSTWPLQSLSTYLTRSLRRTQHIAHEGQIVRAICAGQNLAVLESTFDILREEGAILEEAVSDDEESEKGENGAEGRTLDEKAMLHDDGQVYAHVGGAETA